MGSWDGFRTKHFFQPKPVSSVLYFWRKYWGDRAALLSCLIIFPFSLGPYKLKNRLFANLFSLIIFILFLPIFIIRFIFSWIQSTNMINQGALIDELDST